MSFRVSAVVAATAVLGLGSLMPASAQPQAPVRPRYGTFGNIFSPSPQPFAPGGGAFGQNLPFVNPIGPQVAGGGNFGQFAYPGLGYPGQVGFPAGFAGDPNLVYPQLPASGVVGTFNSGGQRSGYYGHWYPNGVANGRGILGYGGGGGGFGGGLGGGVGPVIGGGLQGQGRAGGSLAGTALGAGAVYGSLRR